MKKKRTLISLIALALVMVVGIGFAAITRTLSITGTVKVQANADVFKVEFEEAAGESYTVDTTDKKLATITVEKSEALDAAGENVKVNLTIKNNSTDAYSAKLKNIQIKDVSSSDITVTTNFDEIDDANIARGSEVKLIVTITLNRAQVEDAQFSFKITFDAESVAA